MFSSHGSDRDKIIVAVAGIRSLSVVIGIHFCNKDETKSKVFASHGSDGDKIIVAVAWKRSLFVVIGIHFLQQ